MISVCIPTYNGEKFIKEQIDSILSQLSAEDEIIISDDGSMDKTLEILSSYNDLRIKIFHHVDSYKSENRFNLTSRNISNALVKASGDLIFLADQDDVWTPDKVAICKSNLKFNDLILHDCEIIDEHGKLLNHSYFNYNHSKPGITRNLLKNSYLGCCMAMKRSVLEFAFPFPKQEVPHDIWLGIVAEKFGKVVFLNNKLVKYRRHGNNLSASGEKSSNNIIFKIKYRLIILWELLTI